MKKSENRISLTRGSAITFMSNASLIILSIIPAIIIARVLGPTIKGIYVLMALIPVSLIRLGTLGIQSSNTYFSGNRKYKVSEISSNSIILSLFLSSILILLFWAVSNINIFHDFITAKGINLFYLWLVMIAIPFSLTSQFYHAILVGREKIIQFNGLNIFCVIFDIIVVSFLLLILKLGLFGVVLWWISSSIIMCFLRIYFVNKIEKITFTFNFKLLKDSLRYGLKSYLGGVSQFLNYRLDTFLVAYFLAPAFVGYYSIAVGFAERLWMLPGSIATVLFPRISSIDVKYANILTPKVSRLTLFIVSTLAIGLFFTARPIIKLFYGIAYLPAVKPFIILLPGIVTLSICKIFTADLSGRGKPEFGTIASVISLGFNVPLNLWLIPKWGISGAAFASTVSYSVSTLIIFIVFLKISKSSLLDTLFIKKEDINTYIMPKLRKFKDIFIYKI